MKNGVGVGGEGFLESLLVCRVSLCVCVFGALFAVVSWFLEWVFVLFLDLPLGKGVWESLPLQPGGSSRRLTANYPRKFMVIELFRNAKHSESAQKKISELIQELEGWC